VSYGVFYEIKLSVESMHLYPLKLGLIEFVHPFRLLRPPGGRDLMSLVLFITGSMLLFMVLLGARAGILSNLTNTMFGQVKGHGVPLSFGYNILDASAGRGIDRKVLNSIGKVKGEAVETIFSYFPYGEIEGDTNPYVLWPRQDEHDLEFWKQPEPGGFSGWAVDKTHPLWEQVVPSFESIDFSLTLIASLEQFKAYFNISDYRKYLDRHSISHNLYLVDKMEDIDALWFEVRIGKKRELFKFQVYWTDLIRSADNPSFLFPLSTYTAIHAVNVSGISYNLDADSELTFNVSVDKHLIYFPETSQSGSRERGPFVLDSTAAKNAMNEFTSCIGGEARSLSRYTVINIKRLVTVNSLDTCKEYLPESGKVTSRNPPILETKLVWNDYGFVQLSCDTTLPEQMQSECYSNKVVLGNLEFQITPSEFEKFVSCLGADVFGSTVYFSAMDSSLTDNCKKHIKMGSIEYVKLEAPFKIIDLAQSEGYNNINVYVHNSKDIKNVSDSLLTAGYQSANGHINYLRLLPVYRDAIDQFALLSLSVASTVPSIGFVLCGVILLILSVKITTLIAHRKRDIGGLLAKGMPGYSVYTIFMMQIILGSIVGFILAFALIQPVVSIANGKFTKDVLTPMTDLRLDPELIRSVIHLSTTEYLIAFLFVFGVSMVACVANLRFVLPSKKNAVVSDLLVR